MLQYPNRRGWTVRYSPHGILYLDETGTKPTNAKLEDFIQTWLYFGFLHELFGDFADIKSFVTENSQGKPMVTTAPLQDCLETLFKRWKGDTPSHGPEEKEAVRAIAQLDFFVGQSSPWHGLCKMTAKCAFMKAYENIHYQRLQVDA